MSASAVQHPTARFFRIPAAAVLLGMQGATTRRRRTGSRVRVLLHFKTPPSLSRPLGQLQLQSKLLPAALALAPSRSPRGAPTIRGSLDPTATMLRPPPLLSSCRDRSASSAARVAPPVTLSEARRQRRSSGGEPPALGSASARPRGRSLNSHSVRSVPPPLHTVHSPFNSSEFRPSVA